MFNMVQLYVPLPDLSNSSIPGYSVSLVRSAMRSWMDQCLGAGCGDWDGGCVGLEEKPSPTEVMLKVEIC